MRIMKKEQKNSHKMMDENGFTLVELIVAMAILAILVGVLVPNVIRYIEKARERKDERVVDAYYMAAKQAMADPDAYDDVQNMFGKAGRYDGGTGQWPTIEIDANGKITCARNDQSFQNGAFMKEFKANLGSEKGTVYKSKKYKGHVTRIIFGHDYRAGEEEIISLSVRILNNAWGSQGTDTNSLYNIGRGFNGE